MNLNEKEIERAIEKILSLGEKKQVSASPEPVEKSKIRRRSGRPPSRDSIPVWAIDYNDPAKNRTLALISMCIKEDYSQSLSELAMRLALCKACSPDECLEKLLELQRAGHLGYYDDATRIFCVWEKGGDGLGLEVVCG